jgi:hypothetical protein
MNGWKMHGIQASSFRGLLTHNFSSSFVMTGDSGGPLIVKGDHNDTSDDVQVGLTSWGWDCGQQPGVYARVSEGYEWIRDLVCTISNNPPEAFHCQSQVQVISQQEQQEQEQQEQEQEQEQEQQQQQQQQQQQEQQQQETIPISPEQSLIVSMTQEHIDGTNYFTAYTRPRASLPEGTPCRSVIDPQICCVSRDSSTLYHDQNCILAPSGQSFSSGSQCESVGWVKDNVDQSDISNRYYSIPNDEVCNALFDDDRKIKFPQLSSCFGIASKRACCMAMDDDGNPCIPSRGFTRFSTGSRCESSTFVATNEPDNAGSCTLW